MKRLGLLLVTLAMLVTPAYAGKISSRSSATALTGAETIGVIQGGVDKKTTVGAISGTNVTQLSRYSSTDLCAAGTGVIDTIGATVTTLMVDVAATCTATKSVPLTLSIVFTGQGLVTISNGVTLTFNGPFNAPMNKVFTLTGTGVAKFGAGSTLYLYPAWWGVTPNAAGDDYPGIQAALTAAGGLHDPGGNGRGTDAAVFLPTGEYTLTAALKMPPSTRLIGESREGTQLNPALNINGIELLGADWGGGFDFRNTIENLSIFYTAGANTGYYIKIDSAYDVSVHNVFLWNTEGNGVYVARVNQVVFDNVDIDGRVTNTTGTGLTLINGTFTMVGGVVEFFQTHIHISKTVSSTTARFFGVYHEQLANSTAMILDNVQGTLISGNNFSNAAGNNTPIGISYINGSHHNTMIGGNFGDGTQFGWSPPIKTDATSYNNRAIGVLFGYYYNGNLGTRPDGALGINNSLITKIVTYTTPMTFDMETGERFSITATNGTAFTINAPTNTGAIGAKLDVIIRNAAGGALGTATWNAVFKMPTWVQPANGFSRSVQFVWDGTNWVETFRSAADVPN